MTHRHDGGARRLLPGREPVRFGGTLPSGTIRKPTHLVEQGCGCPGVPPGSSSGPLWSCCSSTSAQHLPAAGAWLLHTWVLDTLCKAYLEHTLPGAGSRPLCKVKPGRQLAKANTGRGPRRAERISRRRGQRPCVNCGPQINTQKHTGEGRDGPPRRSKEQQQTS